MLMRTKTTAAAEHAPTRRHGSHTVAALRARCVRSGEHWLWTGCMVRNRPVASINNQRIHGARIVAHVLGRDAERQPHQRWTMACGVPACLAPGCLRLADSQGDALRLQSAAGRMKRGTGTSLAISQSRRKAGLCYPDEMVQWALDSGQSDTAVAHAIGCCKDTVATWRGRRRKSNVQAAGLWGQLLIAGASARKAG